MQGQLAGKHGGVVPHGSRGPRDTSEEARLQAVLSEEAASEGANLEVMVTRGCGAIEVRVFGPAAALTLFFDRADAHVAAVRLAVRAAMARYGSALGHQTADWGKECAMLVHVRAQDLDLVGAIQRHLERRVRGALRPSAARVSSVTLALSDINGPRGGTDLRCVVTVDLVPNGSVRAEATGSDLLSAVGRALARARRALLGRAKRERSVSASSLAAPSGAATERGLRARS